MKFRGEVVSERSLQGMPQISELCGGDKGVSGELRGKEGEEIGSQSEKATKRERAKRGFALPPPTLPPS